MLTVYHFKNAAAAHKGRTLYGEIINDMAARTRGVSAGHFDMRLFRPVDVKIYAMARKPIVSLTQVHKRRAA